jgi:Putative Actinobacterial Holin-X, holin superfamily III
MPTPVAETQVDETPGVGTAAKQVAEHASTLARLEFELAGLELKQKAGAFRTGVGLGAGAAVVALYAVGFLFATVAFVLATFLDAWLAVLIVTVALFGVAAILGLIARVQIKRATPPVPEQAIREAKLTQEALKANGHHS